MTDVRLNPDFHDKTAEQMLADLALEWVVDIRGKADSWVVSVTKPSEGTFETVESPTLYQAVLVAYEKINPPAEDI